LREQISSRVTGLVHYFVVPFLLLGFVMIAINAIAQDPQRLLVLPFMAVPLALFVSTLRFTRVIATDTALIVGSSKREIPYAEIAKVWSLRMVNPAPVTVTLTSGEKIRFFARGRQVGFSEHPVAAELRGRGGLR